MIKLPSRPESSRDRAISIRPDIKVIKDTSKSFPEEEEQKFESSEAGVVDLKNPENSFFHLTVNSASAQRQEESSARESDAE